MTAAFSFFHGSDGRFFAVGKFDIVDLDIELPAPCHAFFVLSFSYCSDGSAALRYDNHIADLHFFQHFEVDIVARLRVSRTKRSVQPKLDRGAIIRSEE